MGNVFMRMMMIFSVAKKIEKNYLKNVDFSIVDFHGDNQ